MVILPNIDFLIRENTFIFIMKNKDWNINSFILNNCIMKGTNNLTITCWKHIGNAVSKNALIELYWWVYFYDIFIFKRKIHMISFWFFFNSGKLSDDFAQLSGKKIYQFSRSARRIVIYKLLISCPIELVILNPGAHGCKIISMMIHG